MTEPENRGERPGGTKPVRSFDALLGELRRRKVIRTAVIYLPAAWAVFEGVAQLQEVFGGPDWLPRFVAIMLAIGFPVATILAWIFDLTGGGVRRSGRVAVRGGALVTALVLLGIGGLVTWKLVEPPPVGLDVRCEPAETPYQASVAVLPFRQLGVIGESLSGVADGLAEDIRSLLSRVPGFCVAARGSSIAFADSTDYQDIGRRLSVAHVLEGSVREEQGKIRVTATLVRAGGGSFNLWSDSFDRDMTDLAGLQTNVAREVVGQVHRSALEELDLVIDRWPQLSGDAYYPFLLARYHFNTYLQDNRTRVFDLLQRVTSLEPRFPEAWALLARAYARECGNRGCSQEEEEKVRASAMEAFQRASQLGEQNAAVQALRCFWLRAYMGDREGARAAVERALDLDVNNPEAWECLAELTVQSVAEDAPVDEFRAAYERALEYGRKAVRLDPYNEAILASWADSLLIRRDRREEGLQLLTDAAEILPESAIVRTTLGRFQLEFNQLADSVMSHRSAVRIDPTNPWRRLWLNLAYTFVRDADSLAASIDDMERYGGRLFQLADSRFFHATISDTLEDYLVHLQEERPRDIYHQAMTMMFLGRVAEAEPLLEELAKRPGEPNDLYYGFAMLQLAWIYTRKGRGEDARPMLEAIVATGEWEEARGFNHGDPVSTAAALALLGRYEEALEIAGSGADLTGFLFWQASPAHRALFEQPGFRPIEQEARRHLRAEQQRLERLIAAEGAG